MATFHAYNIEYESEDSEVDDTKELQIEEALKLYQTALKFHSEGPSSFQQAAKAYSALFRSEIFTYPESLSELRRSETLQNYDELLAESVDPSLAQPLIISSETAPNTLPQILHLSYKNHGQFVLDFLAYRVRQCLVKGDDFNENVAKIAKRPLNFFAEALDKDENDLDLWRQSAFAATLAGSYRIARYCLESVLDGDFADLDGGLADSLGIDETLSLHELRLLAKELQDDLSMSLEPLGSSKRRKLSSMLMQLINQHSEIPKPSVHVAAYSERGHYGKDPAKYIITPPSQDWASIGSTILQQCSLEQGDRFDVGPGPGLGFKVSESLLLAEAQIEMGEDSSDAQVIIDDDALQASAARAYAKRIEEEQLLEAENKSPEKDETVIRLSRDGDISDENITQSNELVTGSTRYEIPESSTEAQASQPISRKRSTDSAGLPEVPEGGRVRSKRLRARETLHEEIELTIVESAKDGQSHEELQQFLWSDQVLFDNLEPRFESFGAGGLLQPEILRSLVNKSGGFENEKSFTLHTAIRDSYELMQNCDSESARLLLRPSATAISSVESRRIGLKAFHGHDEPTGGTTAVTAKPPFPPNAHLGQFMIGLNTNWALNKDAAWLWLEALLRPGALAAFNGLTPYTSFLWPEKLKQTASDMIVENDEYFLRRMQEELEIVQERELKTKAFNKVFTLASAEKGLVEMIESLFELHLDVYSVLKSTIGAESSSAIAESQRLDRWSSLSTAAVQLAARESDIRLGLDNISLRHIWAQAFRICLNEESTQDYMVACIRDLKNVMDVANNEAAEISIQLPNSIVISEISLHAAKERLRRMNMKDFFLKMFDEEEQDSVAIIESLEPLLEVSISGTAGQDSDANGEEDPLRMSTNSQNHAILTETQAFIANGSLSLRLALWRRLRDAYETIDYAPKVVSSNLRIVEVVIKELSSAAYHSVNNQKHRIKLLMRYLHYMDDAISRVISSRKTKLANFLECIDEDHLRASVQATCKLLNILQSCRLADDLIAVDQLPMPTIEGRNISYTNLREKIDSMIVYAWLMQYYLLREATVQFPEKFPNPGEDLMELLRSVHFSLGSRGACDAAQKLFLKVSRNELVALGDIPGAHEELCQIVSDLYDIKCSQNPLDCVNHDVPEPENLTRPIALKLIPMVMAQAKKVPLKDLPRSEIRTAIDKLQSALGPPTIAQGAAHMNRRVCTSYIKSAINPIRLRNCVEGRFSLPTKIPTSTIMAMTGRKSATFEVASTPEVSVPGTGWYFLVGNIYLAKWRSQKRVTAGSTDDLDDAARFFVHDLEHRSSENWETWFRLAQTYDALLEEQISWTAEKMNNALSSSGVNGQALLPHDIGLTGEILEFQRKAINCYAMAVSCLIRNGSGAEQGGSDDTDTRDQIATLYTEFGNRVYSASREPFSMRAFQVREGEERYFNRSQPSQAFMYKSPPFKPLKDYGAWKLAANLYKEAVKYKETSWWSYYMLAKCLWKVYSFGGHLSKNIARPDLEELLDTLTQAITVLPKRDSRKEPIMEPHYKMVSIVHKLVMKGDLDPIAASENLRAASVYARKVPSLTADSEDEGWEEYVLAILKILRNTDKSGWHHRMTARAARIIYEGSNKDLFGAMGAKHELTQSIFTKTMILQVWKPEFERPGRHFVFTSRYVRFFVELLDKIADRVSFENLLRRIRKKSHDFYNHEELWKDVVHVYLKLLRRVGNVPENNEESIFRTVSPDDFATRANALEKWGAAPGRESILLEILRQAVDVKKMNAYLVKPPTLFDDLIGDVYASLYHEVTPDLLLDPPTRAGTATPGEGVIPVKSEQLNLVAIGNLAERSGTLSDVNATASGRVRTKVLRRDILKKAETTGAPLSAALPTSAAVSSLRQAEKDKKDGEGSDTSLSAAGRSKRRRSEVSGGKDTDLGKSRSASIHDSADDESESELSDLEGELEIDEEKQEATILTRRKSGARVVQNEDEEEDEDEDEGDGMEEDGEDDEAVGLDQEEDGDVEMEDAKDENDVNTPVE